LGIINIFFKKSTLFESYIIDFFRVKKIRKLQNNDGKFIAYFELPRGLKITKKPE